MADIRREQFAQEVLTAVRGTGVTEAWYDREQFAIAIRQRPADTEPTGWLYLSNVFKECDGVSPDERAFRIYRLRSSRDPQRRDPAATPRRAVSGTRPAVRR
jgi:hypothetical protein